MIKWKPKKIDTDSIIVLILFITVCVMSTVIYNYHQRIDFLEILNAEALAEIRYQKIVRPCTFTDEAGSVTQLNCRDLILPTK